MPSSLRQICQKKLHGCRQEQLKVCQEELVVEEDPWDTASQGIKIKFMKILPPGGITHLIL